MSAVLNALASLTVVLILLAGCGYASEYAMERHVRTTLASTIYGGASEVQRDIIGKTYGL